jgi:hypothetical protein
MNHLSKRLMQPIVWFLEWSEMMVKKTFFLRHRSTEEKIQIKLKKFNFWVPEKENWQKKLTNRLYGVPKMVQHIWFQLDWFCRRHPLVHVWDMIIVWKMGLWMKIMGRYHKMQGWVFKLIGWSLSSQRKQCWDN